jgi:predicted nucleic acid-binding Zn finger protein
MKKDLKIVAIVGILMSAILFLPLTAVGVEPTELSIGDVIAAPGDAKITPIMINVTDPSGLGAATINLTYDPSVCVVTDVVRGPSSFDLLISTHPYTNTSGYVRLIASQTGEPGVGPGVIKFADITLTLKAVGDPDDSSTLNLNVEVLRNNTGKLISYVVNNGTFVINTPPTVEITSPENDTWFDSEPVNISFHPQDNEDDSVDYKVYVDGEEVANGTAAVCESTTVNLGVLPDCNHLIEVEVTDSGGMTDSAEVMIHVDLTPPTVEILSPENNTWFDSEEITIIFHSWDNKADTLNYTVYIDDNEVENGTVTNCTEKEVNLGILSECNHVIKVKVTDNVGKSGSAEVMIHVDLTPPTVEILSPGNNTWFDSEEITVMFHPWDNKADLLNYTVYIDDNEVENGIVANCTEKEVNLVIPECTHVIKVEVRDKAGKTGSEEVTIHVAIPPLVSNPSACPPIIPDDTDNAPLWGENPTLNVTVTDGSGIVGVTINLSAIGGSAVQTMTNIDGNIWSVTMNASDGTAGWTGTAYEPYYLQVNATDVKGKSNTSISIELMVMNNGDVSGDGVTDPWDCTYLARSLAGIPGYTMMVDEVAEVSGDSIVDPWDCTYLARYIAGIPGYDKLK